MIYKLISYYSRSDTTGSSPVHCIFNTVTEENLSVWSVFSVESIRKLFFWSIYFLKTELRAHYVFEFSWSRARPRIIIGEQIQISVVILKNWEGSGSQATWGDVHRDEPVIPLCGTFSVVLWGQPGHILSHHCQDCWWSLALSGGQTPAWTKGSARYDEYERKDSQCDPALKYPPSYQSLLPNTLSEAGS